MSLMEPAKKNGDLYIDPVFDSTQIWIWTSDRYSVSIAWVVSFNFGYCNFVDFYSLSHYYVRAVR